jgi:polyisoprenoid-binding protein YceI
MHTTSTMTRRHGRPRSVSVSAAATSAFVAAAVAAATALVSVSPAQAVTAPKAGKACTKAGLKSGLLVCTKKAGKLVWAKVLVTNAATTTVGAGSTATASGTTAAGNGIEGTWKPTPASIVGYRVKEILEGQDAEGAGRTSAVTGTMVILGTTVKSMELSADLTKLESDSGRRDDQVQGRILETSKFPKATMKLKSPIELGSVPADRVEIAKTIAVAFTLHGVTKDVTIDVKARRDGTTIQVTGSLRVAFADYNIDDPSLPPFVKTETNGLLEFALVFAR